MPFTAVASVLLFASVAFACTIVGGQTYTTNSSGSHISGVKVAPGGTIYADAHSVPGYPDYYAIHFLNFKSQQDSMGTCMGKAKPGGGYYDVRISSYQYTSDNFISVMAGTIPSTAQASTSALLCHIDNSNVDYATKSATITIT